MSIKDLITRAHTNAKEKGFWDNPDPELQLALIISEIGEAIEAHREGRFADLKSFNQQNTTPFIVGGEDKNYWFNDLFETYVKDTYEDELADIFIRCCDWCGYMEAETYRDFDDIVDDSYVKKMTEISPKILKRITSYICAIECDDKIVFKSTNLSLFMHYAFMDIITLALRDKVDLERHIELKMQYNSTRPRLHGKRY